MNPQFREGAPDSEGTADSEVAFDRLRAVYQPIVDLSTGQTVAVEGLIRARRADGNRSPTEIFAEAERVGPAAVRRLDEQCMRTVLIGAAALPPGATLFVNVEPTTLASLSSETLESLALLRPPDVQIVVEVTERGVLAEPARLLAGLARVRSLGWRVAIDDVGATPAALALMAFVRPAVIKLDLALVQAKASPSVAATVNAVNAEAQRTGALVLAEGIETPGHLQRALSMGATLGQGWHFAHPGTLPDHWDRVLLLPPARQSTECDRVTPFEVISRTVAPRPTTPGLLAPLADHLEQQAMLLDEMAVVLSSAQDPSYLTPETLRRYETLASVTALTGLVGPGMAAQPAPGVVGGALPPQDPVSREWVVTVVSPHFAAALAARDLDMAPDAAPPADLQQRPMEYVLSYDREAALAAARLLMDRVGSSPGRPVRARPSPDRAAPQVLASDPALPALLARAISTATNGIVIADAQAPGLPLIYVNGAFEQITGYAAKDVVGMNCRFLQGPGTDPAVVQMMARRLHAGREVAVTVLNYRRDGQAFWNELTISPVHDDDGRVTHFIGNQVDVSERVDREARVTYLAYHDALTGLANRTSLMEHLDLELRRLARSGAALAVLYVDLDRFKEVNDLHGHATGDEVLVRVARRMRAVVRTGDIVARLGGDEFVVVLTGLTPDDDAPVRRVVTDLHAALAPALEIPDVSVRVGAQIGVAVAPRDGTDAAALLGLADERMYEGKTAR